MNSIRTLLIFFFFLLPACTVQPPSSHLAAAPDPQTTSPTPVLPTLAPASPTTTPEPAATATPTPTDTPQPTLIPALLLCSPLEGYALETLPDLVSNAFHPPAPGLDDPHHGVDLAIRAPDTQIALPGHPVKAAFSGQVVTILADRFPYGTAIIIETPLEQVPPHWLTLAGIPTPAPTLETRSALTCPPFSSPPAWDEGRRSLYILYAHLQSTADLQAGQTVSCGQALGTVGSSGNALNPHLHFEARVGPGGAGLGSMAHYDPSATLEEMSTYCLWRISGVFQLVDPMPLLKAVP